MRAGATTTGDGISGLSGIWRSGDWPSLLAAFLYFDAAFMIWVLLGPLAPFIAGDLALSPGATGLVIAVPTLAGALLRPFAGHAVDRFGARRTGIAAQAIVIVALAGATLGGVSSYAGLLALGAILGVAGASFAVALPLASRWYPPRMQGLVQGLAGMGNSGVVLAALFAPWLAASFGWRAVFGLFCLPLAAVLLLFALLARDAPHAPPRGRAGSLLKEKDCLQLMGLYAITFGGFVGLAASLPIVLTTRFEIDAVAAGRWTALLVLVGSFVRPLGGGLADRFGGARTLTLLLALAAVALTGAGLARDRDVIVAMLVLVMLALGLGNGAVFQLVPQRFAASGGAATGIIGMAGGLGGFALSLALGYSRQWFGDYAPAFLLFALAALIAGFAVARVAPRWRREWHDRARI
ncbi:MFS transporter [Sphingosinithalassobacter portus]|uniref:MFS transporter n=1 Tax=Stakelama portus TaxID=2676234 RepID=UPI000D6EAC72|nr:MFS transporter [Sphingosinithalassobacter portus]